MVTLEMSKQAKNWKGPLLKWKYSDADTICDCGEQTQTLDHLLKCQAVALSSLFSFFIDNSIIIMQSDSL